MKTIVTTPTTRWLEEKLPCCRKRFWVVSPFVGRCLVDLMRCVPATADRRLVTRTDLRDFASGASDLAAVCSVAAQGVAVAGLPKLHAKVYLLDQTEALVTSANATYSGLHRNWECGVAVDDPEAVRQLAALVRNGFGASDSLTTWKPSELERLAGPVEAIRRSLPRPMELTETAAEELPEVRLDQSDWHGLVGALPGWQRLALEGVANQPGVEFDIQSFYSATLPVAAKRYPRNRHRREKLRQQLQRLREMGVIEFLGEGRYRKLIHPRRDD